MGDLAVAWLAVDDDDAATDPLDERCVVGGRATTFVRTAQDVGSEGLRGLNGDERYAFRGRHHRAIRNDLDRVGDRNAGYRSIGARNDGSDDPTEEFRSCERPCGIMHTDDRGLVGHCGKARTDRLTARRAPGDGSLAISVDGRNHDDDTIADLLGTGAGVIDHTTFAEAFVLFHGPEALTGATTDHDRPDLLSAGHNRAG